MRRSTKSRRLDEGGVVAVIVAIAATVLFGCAALAVDLGNAEARVRSTQAQADLAAVAGGGEGGADLPATLPGGNCSTGNLNGQAKTATASDPSVLDVVEYLNSNRPINDSGLVTVTASQLTDCATDNGEVIHGTINSAGQITADANKVTVISPRALVKFGLAGVLGFQDTNVASRATAEIKTPIGSALPFYAATGCDFGPQTLANPTNGHAADTPNLSHPADTGPQILTSLQTTPGTNPLAIPLNNNPTTTLAISGSGFAGATQVGFFESGTTTAGPEPVKVAVAPADINGSGTKITVSNLPTALTAVQDTWYVRVRSGATALWSTVMTGPNGNPTLNALPISVGTPLLTCGQGSSDGNFGTLRLSNELQGNGNGWQPIAQNVATGLQSTLGPYPDDGTDFKTCNPNVAPSVAWDGPGTNCVETETGLDSDAATSGFIKGNGLTLPSGQNGGLLTKSLDDSNAGCNGTPAQTTILGKQIDNDTLSCFFIDSATTISQVDSSSYSLSGPAFSQNIWYSPRFVAVPVLGQVPDNGGSDYYRIIGFRYGFITEQPQSATKTTPAASGNGITLASNGNSVESIQIIFLNKDSLPPPPSDVIKGYEEYAGSGVKSVLLVD